MAPPRNAFGARLPNLTTIAILSVGLTGCTNSAPAPNPSGSGTASTSPAADAAPTSAPLAESVATLPDGRGTVDVAVRSLTVDVTGKGSSEPVVSETDEQAMAKNRRVELSWTS